MSNSPSSPRNSIAVTEPSSPGTIEKGELHSRKSKKSSSPQRLSTNRSTTTSTSTQSSHSNNAFIKYGSLLLLVGQMVGLVLLMRYTRTHTDGGDLYLASTAVFMMEVSRVHNVLHTIANVYVYTNNTLHIIFDNSRLYTHYR